MIKEGFKIGSDQTMHTEDDQGMDKIIDVGQDMILIIEVAIDIMQGVTKGMGGLTITTIEGEASEIKIVIGIGVGHTKDKTEIEGTVEVLATVDQGQVQEQLQR